MTPADLTATAVGPDVGIDPSSSSAICVVGHDDTLVFQAKAAGSGTTSFEPAGTDDPADGTDFALKLIPTGGPPSFAPVAVVGGWMSARERLSAKIES